MHDLLTDDNYLLYCARHYDNPHCHDMEEFNEDLRRVKYIKKLITRYTITGELKERLILNHLIILNNVFPAPHLTRILFLKMGNQMKYLKPFLLLLNILPDKIYNVSKEGSIFLSDEIPMDDNIIKVLRKL